MPPGLRTRIPVCYSGTRASAIPTPEARPGAHMSTDCAYITEVWAPGVPFGPQWTTTQRVVWSINSQPKPDLHFRAAYNNTLVVGGKSSNGEFPRPDLIQNPNHDLRELERCESLGHNNPCMQCRAL